MGTRLKVACLLGVLAAGGGAEGRDGAAVTARSSDSETCTACHRFPDGLSHPVQVPVLEPVDLPLGPGRRVTCVTCHDPDGHGAETHPYPAALRSAAGQLCARCHAEDPESRTRLAHGLLARLAHPVASNRRRSAAGIDAETAVCMGCHDGSVAEPHRSGVGALGRSHPVGREYDAHSRSGRQRHLRPIRSLPATIRLPGGTVGCGSCHSAFSTEPHMLTVNNRRSRLCLACHAM